VLWTGIALSSIGALMPCRRQLRHVFDSVGATHACNPSFLSKYEVSNDNATLHDKRSVNWRPQPVRMLGFRNIQKLLSAPHTKAAYAFWLCLSVPHPKCMTTSRMSVMIGGTCEASHAWLPEPGSAAATEVCESESYPGSHGTGC